MESAKQPTAEEVCEQILTAAEKRFDIYGYNKTTMAEIAKDCDMSAANLYRYFENKLAIGSALTCRCLSEIINNLQQLVDDTNESASQRLRQFVLMLLEHTYSNWSERPKINELVIAICNEKSSMVDQHHHAKQAVLISILKDGIDRGEFDVDDPEITAETILSATMLFAIPLLMPLFSRKAFERKANQVVDLVLTGLLKR